MIVRFRLGNITETRPVHGKLDHHVSARRKQDGFKQLHVSVEFTKYGNTLFRPAREARASRALNFHKFAPPFCFPRFSFASRTRNKAKKGHS